MKLSQKLEDAEIDRLYEATRETLDAWTRRLRQENGELQQQLSASEEQAAELQEDNDSLRRRQAQYKFSMPLRWVAGATGVCLIGGFLLGLWWVDYRSRKRHGGIRVY